MQQGVFGVTLPKMIRLRRILFGDYRGLLRSHRRSRVAPLGGRAHAVHRTDRRSAQSGRHRSTRASAVIAAAISVYFLLLNASYAYWEGGWSYGPRHASPAIPFLLPRPRRL